MKRGGGSRKGAAFERKVCKALSGWVTGGKRDDLFWRQAMSGGRATLQSRKGKSVKSQVGDIAAIDAEGERLTSLFSVECKFYRDIDLLAGILFEKGRLVKFWFEACYDANLTDHKRIPLLIFKQNRSPILVLTRPDGIDALHVRPIAQFAWDNGDVCLFLFDALLRQRECPLDARPRYE